MEMMILMTYSANREIVKNLKGWNRFQFLAEPYFSYLCDIEGVVPTLAPYSIVIIRNIFPKKINIDLALKMEPVIPCVGAFNFKGFLVIRSGSNLMENLTFDTYSGMKEKKTYHQTSTLDTNLDLKFSKPDLKGHLNTGCFDGSHRKARQSPHDNTRVQYISPLFLKIFSGKLLKTLDFFGIVSGSFGKILFTGEM